MNKVKLECVHCHIVFLRYTHAIVCKNNFCSKDCSRKHKRAKLLRTKECAHCHACINLSKEADYRHRLAPTTPAFCSKKCQGLFKTEREGPLMVICLWCQQQFAKKRSEIKRSPKSFCSKTCCMKHRMKYNPPKKAKPNGHTVSKLEIFLQTKLLENFPDLCFIFNDKEKIGLELDILIPELGIAFELNGLFHYKPVFGQIKLEKTKNNDAKKQILCDLHKIALYVIDTREQNSFKEETSVKYYDLIAGFIDERLKSHELCSSKERSIS